MKKFLHFFFFQFILSSFINFDSNKVEGDPLIINIDNNNELLVFFKKSAFLISSNYNPQSCNLSLLSYLAEMVGVKGFYFKDREVLLLCLSKSNFIRIFKCNIATQCDCSDKDYSKSLDFKKDINRNDFSFFKLSNKEYVYVIPTEKGTAFLKKISPEKPEDNIEMERGYKSGHIKSISCEKFKKVSEILCLFHLYNGTERKNYFKTKLFIFRTNGAPGNSIDFYIFEEINKSGKLDVGSEIKYSKLIKISENNFVVAYFIGTIFNFLHIKYENEKFELNPNKLSISECNYFVEKTDILVINENTFAVICKRINHDNRIENDEVFKIMKIELKNQNLVHTTAELLSSSLELNQSEKIVSFQFSKYGRRYYLLSFSTSNNRVGFVLCEYVYCKTETIGFAKRKETIDFSHFLEISPFHYSDKPTIYFTSYSKGSLHYENSLVKVNEDFTVNKDKPFNFEFFIPSEDVKSEDTFEGNIEYSVYLDDKYFTNEICSLKIKSNNCDKSSMKCLKCEEKYVTKNDVEYEDGRKECINCQNQGGYKLDRANECTKELPNNTYPIDKGAGYYKFCSAKPSFGCKHNCDITVHNFYLDKNKKYQCTDDKTCTKTGNTGKHLIYNDECVSECPKGYYQHQGKCKYIDSDTTKTDEIKNVMSEIANDFLKSKNSTILETDSMKIQVGIQGKSNDEPGVSSINLGECEKKLKEHYKLSADAPLIIVKADIHRNNSAIDQVEYSVYDEKGNLLDLSVCENETIEISYPINEDSNVNLELGKEMESKGIDIYNPQSPFFNDLCFPFTKDGMDVVISDRRTDFYVNTSFCEAGCKYQGIDYQTKKAKCSCTPKKNINSTIKQNEQEELCANNLFQSVTGSININVLTCYKEFFKVENLLKNVGFWFSVEICGFQFTLFFLFLKEFSVWKKKIIVNSLEIAPRSAPPYSESQSTKSEVGEKIQAAKYTMNSRRKKPSIDSLGPEISTRRNLMSEKKVKTVGGVESMLFYKVRDIDNYPYRLASKNDKRNCLTMFWKKLKEKQIFLRAIFVKSQFEFITINLSNFGTYFGLYFTLNALFYTNDLMSSRYKSGGTLTLVQELLRSGLSCVVSVILLSFLRFSGFFSLAMDTIIYEVKMSKDFQRLAEKITKAMKFRIFLFFLIEMIFFIFISLYLSCFCIVYHSTQISWFKGGWISFAISLGVCIGVCIAFSLIRYISLRCQSKSLYNFQLFINRFY